MHLSNLITPSDGATISGQDCQIRSISADSRTVTPGSLFIAVNGTKQDGADFIKEAVRKGAVAIVTEKETNTSDIPSSVSVVKVSLTRHALSSIASRFYPRQPQVIAAVTGTSGKTSTVQFTRQLWELGGHEAASLGTLGLVTSSKKEYGSLTTPDPVTLHQSIDAIAADGITHLAMEASSHGIELHRLDHVRFSLAAFTNLSRDHLDYHETMERYYASKLRLFTTLLQPKGTAVLNADIKEFDDLNAVCKSRGLTVFSFGKNGQSLKLHSVMPESNGQRIEFDLMGKSYEVMLPIIGSFQAYNSLCALSLAVASGESPEKMVRAMELLHGVPGRLEFIGTTPSGGTVFVDYAHKPAALENVLEALRPHVAFKNNAKLHVVFGCGGNRDKGKRPIMGEIAQRLADHVIVTDDNPRNEEAKTIRKEILEGCRPSPTLREIGDRATAISEGINALESGDVLVIAGKGHEEGQIVGDTVLPFNDAEEARKVLGLR